MTVMFCGHGKYSYTEDIRQILKKEIVAAISEGSTIFYQGGYGAYDRMATSLVWELKKSISKLNLCSFCPIWTKKWTPYSMIIPRIHH